ncbi:MAG: NADH-quinone oxidoreductase subunit J [Planctomycetota bacterium]
MISAALLTAAIQWPSFFFLMFALLAGGFALAVVFSNNIVRMAFYLTLSLGSTAGLFFLAGAEFVGAMQFMIYVGGTLVLLIFGVMLTAQERFVKMRTSGGEWVVAAALGFALFALLTRTAIMSPDWTTPRDNAGQLAIVESQHATAIGQAFAGVRTDKLDQAEPHLRAGMAGYLFPFEIASVHLLVVLIGAGYLARAKKRARPASE